MSAPSPIHRDPDVDGNDFGCYSDKANWQVAAGVKNTSRLIRDKELNTADEIVAFVRGWLEHIGDGSTDTIVKENVFWALQPALFRRAIPFDRRLIYGW